MAIVIFKRKIRKSGGSASIAIPPEVLEALQWKIGDAIELFPTGQEMIIRKSVVSKINN